MRNGILDVLVVLQPDGDPAMAVVGDAVTAVLQLDPGIDPCAVRMPPAAVFFSDRTGPLWDAFVLLDVPSALDGGVRVGFDALCSRGHPFVVLAVRDPESWDLDHDPVPIEAEPALATVFHQGAEIVVLDPGQAAGRLRELLGLAVRRAVQRNFSGISLD
jgi:hypothetical protein